MSDPLANRSRRVSCSNFVNILYAADIVDRTEWPTPKILDEMYNRGYHNFVTQRLSYGVQGPPMLTQEDALKWVALFRLLELKRLGN